MRYGRKTRPRGDGMTEPTPDRASLDAMINDRERFTARVKELYWSDPECQDSRRVSFTGAWALAWHKAMQERSAAALAAPAPVIVTLDGQEVCRAVGGDRVEFVSATAAPLPPSESEAHGLDTEEYRQAVSVSLDHVPMSSVAHEWHDNPHRLVYDLCNEVDVLRTALASARSSPWPLTPSVHEARKEFFAALLSDLRGETHKTADAKLDILCSAVAAAARAESHTPDRAALAERLNALAKLIREARPFNTVTNHHIERDLTDAAASLAAPATVKATPTENHKVTVGHLKTPWPLPESVAKAKDTLLEATYGEFARPCPEREACANALIVLTGNAVMAEMINWLTEEATVTHLAHRVDDVSPNRTFSEDIEDARVYCQTLADYARVVLRWSTGG